MAGRRTPATSARARRGHRQAHCADGRARPRRASPPILRRNARASSSQTPPGARVARAAAEAIPLATSSVDVVVAAQCLHLFDHERAMPEIARVLRPGGSLRDRPIRGDRRIPWVNKVYSLIGAPPTADDYDPVAGSDVFELAEQDRREALAGVPPRQPGRLRRVDVDGRQPRRRPSASSVLIAAEELYDSYGRGPDGLLMPWLTHCYRGRVAGLTTGVGSNRRRADPAHRQRRSRRRTPDRLLLRSGRRHRLDGFGFTSCERLRR